MRNISKAEKVTTEGNRSTTSTHTSKRKRNYRRDGIKQTSEENKKNSEIIGEIA